MARRAAAASSRRSDPDRDPAPGVEPVAAPEAAGSVAVGSGVVGSVAGGSEVAGSEVAGSEVAGSEVGGSVASGSEVGGSEVGGSVAAGSVAASVEAARLGLARLSAMLGSRRNAASVAGAAGVDLSQQALRVLEALETARSPAEIARRARMDPAAVSRQLRTLEGDGLVRRRAAESGGLVSVSATREGRALVARVRKVRSAHLNDALAGWSSADREALGSLLSRVVDDLARTPVRPLPHRRSSVPPRVPPTNG